MKLNKNMTIADWLDYWFDTFVKSTVKRATAVSYTGYITNHIAPQIGLYKLSDVNTSVVQKYFNYEMESGNLKNGSGLSPKTLHNIRMMLHKAFEKAVELELLAKNYIEYVELPRMVKPEIHILSEQEQKRMFEELTHTDEALYFGVYLSLCTGMRMGEVLGLRWSDVDFDDNVIHIRRTVNRLESVNGKKKTEIVVGTPKSENAIRDIPITDKMHDEFIKYMFKVKERLNIKVLKDTDYVLMLRKGFPTEPKTMQNIYYRIRTAAGIKNNVTFHGLRHTFATRAVERGVDIKTLSVLLGHSDVSFTLSRYTHISDKQKRDAMSLIFDE